MRKTRSRHFRTKNNRRKGGANTTRRANKMKEFELLKVECKKNKNKKAYVKEYDAAAKKLEEMTYQKEKLEQKMQVLSDCIHGEGIEVGSAKSFVRVAPGHVKVVKEKGASQGSTRSESASSNSKGYLSFGSLIEEPF